MALQINLFAPTRGRKRPPAYEPATAASSPKRPAVGPQKLFQDDWMDAGDIPENSPAASGAAPRRFGTGNRYGGARARSRRSTGSIPPGPSARSSLSFGNPAPQPEMRPRRTLRGSMRAEPSFKPLDDEDTPPARIMSDIEEAPQIAGPPSFTSSSTSCSGSLIPAQYPPALKQPAMMRPFKPPGMARTKPSPPPSKTFSPASIPCSNPPAEEDQAVEAEPSQVSASPGWPDASQEEKIVEEEEDAAFEEDQADSESEYDEDDVKPDTSRRKSTRVSAVASAVASHLSTPRATSDELSSASGSRPRRAAASNANDKIHTGYRDPWGKKVKAKSPVRPPKGYAKRGRKDEIDDDASPPPKKIARTRLQKAQVIENSESEELPAAASPSSAAASPTPVEEERSLDVDDRAEIVQLRLRIDALQAEGKERDKELQDRDRELQARDKALQARDKAFDKLKVEKLELQQITERQATEITALRAETALHRPWATTREELDDEYVRREVLGPSLQKHFGIRYVGDPIPGPALRGEEDVDVRNIKLLQCREPRQFKWAKDILTRDPSPLSFEDEERVGEKDDPIGMRQVVDVKLRDDFGYLKEVLDEIGFPEVNQYSDAVVDEIKGMIPLIHELIGLKMCTEGLQSRIKGERRKAEGCARRSKARDAGWRAGEGDD